jgi:hypothetical protein
MLTAIVAVQIISICWALTFCFFDLFLGLAFRLSLANNLDIK